MYIQKLIKKTTVIIFLTAFMGTIVSKYLPKLPFQIFAQTSVPTVQVTPVSSNSSTIKVTFPHAVVDGDIADFELNDKNNQKVWQRYSSIGSSTYTMSVSGLPNGDYKLNVGLFKPNWANNYAWYPGIATLKFPTNITSSLTSTPAPMLSATQTPTPLPTTIPAAPQSQLFTVAMSAYNDWKAKYVVSVDSLSSRVVRPENNNDTVSEGIGYGMVLSQFANDQVTFNKLWQYAQKYFDGKGLMNWNINAQGGVIGTGSATDADEDMAYALIKANQKWGGNGYDSAAKNIIASIKAYEMVNGNYIGPGDNWGNTQVMNPSYIAPSYYKAFASLTGDSSWNAIANANTIWLQKAANTNTGLVPDWLNNDLSQANINWDAHSRDFYYDAVRVPIRLLMSYKYDGDPTAQGILNKQSSFFSSVGVNNLRSGYTLSGSPIESYLDTTFLSGYAAAGQVDSNSSYAQSIMSKLVSSAPTGYFGTTLRVLTLFISSTTN